MAGQEVEVIYVELQANIAKFKAAMHDATAETQKFSSEMKAQSREAQGTIALLGDEIGVTLPRHLRSFVAQLPGVSSALSAAFSIVAVAGLVGVVIEAGKRVAEFIAKTKEAALQNKIAWGGITDGLRTYDDSLRLANDKLENSIAVLEHKPQNGLKQAIDEAITSADTLGQKLDADIGKIAQTLKSQQVSLFSAQYLSGQQRTTDVTERAEELQSRLLDINSEEGQHLRTLREQHATQQQINDETEKYNQLRRQAISDQQKWVSDQLATEQKHSQAYAAVGLTGDVQPNRERVKQLSGFSANLGYAADTIIDTEDNTALTNQQGALQKAKEAQDQLLKQYDQLLTGLKHEKEMLGQAWSPQDDEAFWQSHISSFQQGSDAFLKVQQTIWTAQEEASKKFQQQIKDMLAGQQRAAKEAMDLANQQAQAAKTSADSIARATAQTGVGQARINAQGSLATAELQARLGEINPNQLAQAQAAAHVAEYQEQLQALQQELADLHKNDFGSLSGENTAKEMAVQLQINEAESKAHIQAMEDAQNEFATTWKGTITGIYDTVIQKSQQAMEQVKNISVEFIEGMNEVLAKTLTERHTAGWTRDFRNSVSDQFRSGAEGLAKTSLERIEGGVLGGLGLGKRDGSSAAKALYVQMTSGAGAGTSGLPDFSKLGSGYPQIFGPNGQTSGSAPSITGGLLGWLNNSNWASSLFGGKLFGSGSLFGGYATGGDVIAGHAIDVGELGPERFVPYTNGQIIPNSQLTKNAPNIHIDARYSSDPAQTQVAVHRAMRAYYPQSVAAATAAQKDMAARRPSSAR